MDSYLGCHESPAGSTIPLHLKATFEEGWHLYSLTTPLAVQSRPPLALAENPAVKGSKLYQPQPIRNFDKNFNARHRNFEKEVDFAADSRSRQDAPAGPVELTANVRYQACNDQQCLPPRKKTASFTIDDRSAASARLRSDSRRIHGNQDRRSRSQVSCERRSTRVAGNAGAGRARRVPDHRLRTRPRRDLHALRVPDDPDHRFVLPEPARRRLCRRWCSRLGIVVLFCALGLGVTAAVGPFGVNQLGANPWVNGFIALVFGAFRAQLAGSVRNHAAVEHADQTRFRLAPRRLSGHAADGADVRADFVRLHRTIHGEPAGGVGAIERRCSPSWAW